MFLVSFLLQIVHYATHTNKVINRLTSHLLHLYRKDRSCTSRLLFLRDNTAPTVRIQIFFWLCVLYKDKEILFLRDLPLSSSSSPRPTKRPRDQILTLLIILISWSLIRRLKIQNRIARIDHKRWIASSFVWKRLEGLQITRYLSTKSFLSVR